jgi:hypothetical protein
MPKRTGARNVVKHGPLVTVAEQHRREQDGVEVNVWRRVSGALGHYISSHSLSLPMNWYSSTSSGFFHHSSHLSVYVAVIDGYPMGASN